MESGPDLPILAARDELTRALRTYPRLLLTAPTGSGKSTQVPQFILDDLLRPEEGVVVLQPRRLACRLLARWVATQRGTRLGEEVGYQVRFESCIGPRTRLRYVTEGLLLRQLLTKPTLPDVRAVVLDEFHERHLEADLMLGLLRRLQETERPDLLLVVMSATLDVASLRDYLAPCEVRSVTGRQYPVEISYLAKPPRDESIWDVVAAQLDRPFEGDALVFMPGSYEIQRTIRAIQERHGGRFIVLPLHGDLPVRDQEAALARYDRPKIVVATNVAETSVTIDGIRLVIDSGLARISRFDPQRGFNTLWVERISRASADQRAGRAGRTAPGQCWRLWTERDHQQRPAHELPEIKRVHLAETVLVLKALGFHRVTDFPWLETPPASALQHAEELLMDLGALDRQGSLTPLGQEMLTYPVHPRHARMLREANLRGCVPAVALIAALTQARDLWLRNTGRPVEEARAELFGDEHESDFYRLMTAYRYAERHQFSPAACERVGIHAHAARQVKQIAEQFVRLASESPQAGSQASGSPNDRDAAIRKCVLTGFVDHLARRVDKGTRRCVMVHGRRGVLASDSTVTAPLFVAAEVAEVQGRELQVTLRWATAVEEAWLRELFPDDWRDERELVFDETNRRVMLEERRKFRDLVLHAVQRDAEPSSETARLLAAHCELPGWNDAVEQWIVRVNAVARWLPELGLSPIGEGERRLLKETVCRGAVSFKEIKERPVLPVVKSWLPAQQQAWVEEYAPERLLLPCGRRVKVRYAEGKPPMIAAPIQDLYGVDGPLRIAKGRATVVVEVLAPNHRAVQVTSDLASFWREQYPKLKQELQRKYPKHEWR